jgi:hypothetical protein
MSNQIKLAAIAILIIVIGSGSIFISGVFKPKKDDQLVNVNSSSISLVSNSVVSTSSASMVSSTPSSSKFVSSESQVVPSIPTVQYSSKAVDVVSSKIAQEIIQDIPNVIKLSTDKSIYHQYIKDYLACPTKFYQVFNGGYKYQKDEVYKYLCIPQNEIDKCTQGILIYGLKTSVGNKIPITNPKIIKIEPTLKNPEGLIRELENVKDGVYYCMSNSEGLTSVSIPGVFYNGYIPDNKIKVIKGYYAIPKINLGAVQGMMNEGDLSFAAIPLSSFSKEDQEYIANNFKVQ